MTESKRIVIDAGHGGIETGAVFGTRQEKNDNLRLALAVGQILSRAGQQVGYTRVTDVHQSSLERAEMANHANADYFISLHRNVMPIPGTASGAESLVYENSGAAGAMAANINSELGNAGFNNLGTVERPGVIVLGQTRMPAVLVEVGFIDNDIDNELFDMNFQHIAEAIARGILMTAEQEEMAPEYYQVQVGAFRNQDYAEQLLRQLRGQGFPAFIVVEDGMFKVRAGAFLNIDNAARMEQVLRNMGYTTFMVKAPAVY